MPQLNTFNGYGTYEHTRSYSTIKKLSDYMEKHNLLNERYLIIQIPDMEDVPRDQVGRFTAIFAANQGENAWISMNHGFKTLG